jgi:hypothetical protein
MGLIKRLLLDRPLRWLFVMAGAIVGSYAGRVAGAAWRGEAIEPLLKLDRRSVLRPDALPAFLAVEFVGRLTRLTPLGAALVAAAATGLIAFLDGPLRPWGGEHSPDVPEPRPE